MATVHLVDASPYIFRAHFSLPASIKAPDGSPAAAAYGFTSFLLKLVADEKPSHLGVAFDRSLNSSFRNELFPAYKEQRVLPPPELEAQLDACREIAAALGAATFVDDRYEADDLIGTLCAGLEAAGHGAVIVTSDKDLAQLVTGRTSLLDFAKGLRFTAESVREKFGVRPDQMTDFLGLAGDSVDNIPGVKGIGATSAAELLNRFDHLEDLYARLEEVPWLPIRGAKSLHAKLAAARETAFLSKRLATVERAVPGVTGNLESLELRGADPARGGFDRPAIMGYRRGGGQLIPLNLPERFFMSKARVAVVKTSPATVLADVGRTMELAEVRRHLAPGVPTILKDNISWHFPFPGANTTPWQLEGTIQKLRADGYTDQVCVQNNTVVTDPKKGERLNRYLPVLDKYGVPVRYNCFADDLKWVRYEPKGKMLVLPKIYPEGITIPEFFLGKNIVHLPTVKCHIYTTTTGAMKNAFGGLLNTRRHYTHSWIHETLVDLLTIQKEIHSGLFAVMDGTTCGNGPGPRTMIPVEKDILLASGDQVAIDAVSAKMMGFDPLSIPYIRLAHDAGLGVGDPRDIEIVGEDVSKWNFRFSVGDNAVSRFGDLVWFGPLRGLQKLLFRTPLVYFFVFGSYFYHDFAWYPTIGKRRIEQYKKTSKWMRLFEQYPKAVQEEEKAA